jgi:4-diphosphocytidyl-2-C-methyl-D-erythritol kinase
LVELAPAKINLGLSVLGKLQNGYHSLHTLFAALEVADVLHINPIPEGIELEVIGMGLAADIHNLAYKAAVAYLSAAGWPGGVRIELQKNLPLAAGLGGGSSDAAAVLRALVKIYPAGLNVDVFALATKLGADVPFFLHGGLAEARGIGELLSPLEPLKLGVVLVNPGLHIAASLAYGHLKNYQAELDIISVLEALKAGQEPPYWNTLESSVFALEPSLLALKTELQTLGLKGVLMSGSGSTLFGLATPDKTAEIAQEIQGKYPNFWVQATCTV